MFTFGSRIEGVPCRIQVDQYDLGKQDSFKFTVLDKHNLPAPELQAKVTDSINQRLFEEFIYERADEYYRPY